MILAVQVIQLVLSVLLIALVLIQSKGVGLGRSFGGGGEVYHTRRGAERVIFIFTIVIAMLFVASSTLNVVIS